MMSKQQFYTAARCVLSHFTGVLGIGEPTAL